MPGRAYGLRSFTLTLNGSAQQLSSTSIYAASVEIFSNTGNDLVHVGGSDVSATIGRPVAAGAVFSVPEAYTRGSNDLYDLANIYVIGTNTQVIRVIYNTTIG